MTFDVDHVLENATNLEKWQLLSGDDFWHTAALERFNVPRARFSDGPNGIRGTRFFAGVSALCLPCGTALGATWDRDLLHRAGELLARECIAKGVHCWLGPTINIQRSPLGGRGFESYSEDPYLSGILASAVIKGCEGLGIQATPKHFVCNDQEHERRAVNTIITERALREIYLKPFQIVARDAKPGALMTAYNKVNGVHVSDNAHLLNGLVREEWNWDPLIVSDWHGTYSTAEAVNAGLDLEMPGPPKMRGVIGDFLHSSRMIATSTLNTRARRVLQFVKRASEVKVSNSEGECDSAEDRDFNREICAKSIVLLKNERDLLPLPKRARKVALLGSHMKNTAISGGGSAVLQPYYTVTPFEAIKSRLEAEGTEVVYDVGAYAHKMLPLLEKEILRPDNEGLGGIMRFYNEPCSVKDRKCVAEEVFLTAYCQLMDYRNPKLNFELFYIQAEAIFIPDASGMWDFGLSVYGTANLYIDNDLVIDETTPAQQAGGAFFGKGTPERFGQRGLEAGKGYHLRLEFGSAGTSKSPNVGVTTFGGGGFRLGAARRIELKEGIRRACELVRDVDYTILCTGLSAEWETEGHDRAHMDLPQGVDELIHEVLKVQKNTIIITQSGTPISMPWINDASTLLHAWYGGNETGNGIADILFGTINPSGKLPLSWPRQLEDNPTYLNFGSSQGRVLYGEDIFVGYRYYDQLKTRSAIMFPFGYGLSYTTFEIAPLSLTRQCAIVRITNTGRIPGTETVQLYVHAKSSGVQRPYKELHGFQSVNLDAGHSADLEISIDKYSGAFWDESEHQWKTEAGSYEVYCGTSSQEKDLVRVGTFDVETTSHWLGL